MVRERFRLNLGRLLAETAVKMWSETAQPIAAAVLRQRIIVGGVRGRMHCGVSANNSSDKH